jgi:hypothetical protein
VPAFLAEAVDEQLSADVRSPAKQVVRRDLLDQGPYGNLLAKILGGLVAGPTPPKPEVELRGDVRPPL